MKNVFLTCLNSDKYLYGLLMLNQSFRKNNNGYDLYVLCTEEINQKYGKILEEEKMKLILANDIEIDQSISKRLYDGNLSHWIKTFFKLNIFKLTQFDKIIYLDSDMLILNSLDELFEKETISAVDDADFMILDDFDEGLNSGLMVLNPSVDIYNKLIDIIPIVGTKRRVFGDQNVIQEIYNNFHGDISKHLSIKYNACFYLLDRYSNKKFNVIHFMGAKKPWNWNLAYAFTRITSYLLRGRFLTFKYSLYYYCLYLKFKFKYAKFIKNNT